MVSPWVRLAIVGRFNPSLGVLGQSLHFEMGIQPGDALTPKPVSLILARGIFKSLKDGFSRWGWLLSLYTSGLVEEQGSFENVSVLDPLPHSVLWF